jgi:hypothetical protein
LSGVMEAYAIGCGCAVELNMAQNIQYVKEIN